MGAKFKNEAGAHRTGERGLPLANRNSFASHCLWRLATGGGIYLENGCCKPVAGRHYRSQFIAQPGAQIRCA